MKLCPPDFRYPGRFLNGSGEEAIAETLAEGIAVHRPAAGKSVPHHNLVMPRFAHLTVKERRSIALYVIALGNTTNSAKAVHP